LLRSGSGSLYAPYVRGITLGDADHYAPSNHEAASGFADLTGGAEIGIDLGGVQPIVLSDCFR
jgi:hypothetical protein